MKQILKSVFVTLLVFPLSFLVLKAIQQSIYNIPLIDYWRAYWNSFLLTVPTVIIQTICAIIVAFWAVLRNSRFGKTLLLFYCMLTVFPIQTLLLPEYLVAKSLGVLDTKWAIWLLGFFAPLPVFLILKRMSNLSKAQIEAAMLDGASNRQLFYQIFLPQIKGEVQLIAMLSFIDNWSILEFPSVLLFDTKMMPMAVFFSNNSIELPYALSLFYSIPPVILFAVSLVFSKHD